MKFAKNMVIIGWLLLIVASFISFFSAQTQSVILLLQLLIVIHFIEFLLFIPMLKRSERKLSSHFVQVMIFGVVYYWQVRSKMAK